MEPTTGHTPDPGRRDLPAPAERPVTTDGRPHPLPVLLHLDGAPCLVVGAGPVGARKARALLSAGADVTVVAPELGAELATLAVAGPPELGTLSVETRPYRSPEAAGYLLVVSATGDPGVDARVAADAASGGALVNPADPPGDGAGRGAGTVLLPAVHRDGPVTVAVSTDGSGPALARWLRDRLAGEFTTARVAVLAGLVDEARGTLVGAGIPASALDWSAALDRIAPLVADDRVDDARRLLGRLAAAAVPGPRENPPSGSTT